MNFFPNPFPSLKVKVKVLVAQLCLTHCTDMGVSETPWTETCQAPLFKGFSGQESWRGYPFPLPGDLPT